MSFITRCPACATRFKVVADQLKVSQGWVRCGTCAEVFDAGMNAHDETVEAEPALPQTADHTGDQGNDSDGLVPGDSRVWVSSAAASLGIETPPDSAQAHALRSGFDTPAPSIHADSSDLAASDALATEFQSVSFVRKARRDAFWQRTSVRAMLVAAAACLAMLLGAQFTLQHKDTLAAVNPRLAPTLQQLCRPLGCSLQAVRRIDSVVIDSASFSKTDGKSFRLSFVLKNIGDVPLQVPLLELTLTDIQDKPLLRRVLSPEQFGVPSRALLPIRGEANGLVNLIVAGDAVVAAGVAGYRVLVFYP